MVGALFCGQFTHIEPQIIAFAVMHHLLPARHRRRYARARCIKPVLRIGIAPRHDGVDIAVDADEIDRKAGQRLGQHR